MGKFFPPKDCSSKTKSIRNLHIESLVLMVVLMIMLSSSLMLIGRMFFEVIIFNTVLPVDLMYSNQGELTEMIENGNMYAALDYEPEFTPLYYAYSSVMKILTVAGYTMAFVSIAGSIVLLILMKKACRSIVEDPTPAENPVTVKKTPYVWLGFLLGCFGGQLFLYNNKKAIYYLCMGIIGLFFPIFLLYTTGISFADAFLACFISKDENGEIIIEDYPYWI